MNEAMDSSEVVPEHLHRPEHLSYVSYQTPIPVKESPPCGRKPSLWRKNTPVEEKPSPLRLPEDLEPPSADDR